MKLLPDEQRMMQRIETGVNIRLHCFSKHCILAPTAFMRPWWQAPKPPAEAGIRAGAIEEQVAGAN